MMLNNSRKAEQARGTKTEPGVDFILEILNLDSQRENTEARSMKSSFKPKDKKRSPGDLCPYCSRPGHAQDKCYYKHPERASQKFRERFKDRTTELRAKARSTKGQDEFNAEEIPEPYSSEIEVILPKIKGQS